MISQKGHRGTEHHTEATKVPSAELDCKCFSTLSIMHEEGKSRLFLLFQFAVKASKYFMQGSSQRLQNVGTVLL